MGALAPVFVPSTPGERRAVTVFFPVMSQPARTGWSGREAMSAITGDELRRRTGRLDPRAAPPRHRPRHRDGRETRQGPRAGPPVRRAAAVTVPNTWPITDYARRLDASIRVAGYVPQRLDLAQDAGFAAAAIPLGIGLPRRRGRQMTPPPPRAGAASPTWWPTSATTSRPRPQPAAPVVEGKLFARMVPPRGRAARAAGWSPRTGAAVGVADDLGTDAGVLAADRRPRAAADRRADGHRLAVRRGVLLRPDRLGHRRHRSR